MYLYEKYNVNSVDQIRWNTKTYGEYTNDTINNMIIVGPSGSGKKTFVRILLRTIYGNKNDSIWEEEFTIKNYGNNTQSVTMSVSKYSIYFKPIGSALDKYIIQEILINFISCNDLKLTDDVINFKTIVIYGFDELSYHSQAALRRILEEKSQHCRFIIIGENLGTLIEPVRNRCQLVQIHPPTRDELLDFCKHVLTCEGIECTNQCMVDMVDSSVFEPKTLLWKLEMYRLGIQYTILWHTEIQNICDIILSNQITQNITMSCVKKIRTCIGKLFITNIDINIVCEELFKQLYMKINSPPIVANINSHICEYNCRIQNSTRYMLHMEAMIYKIIHSLKE